MKGFLFLGLLAGPFYYAQSDSDSLRTKEIEAITFTQRLPVAKEVISVEKSLDKKNLGQDLPFLLKNQTSIISTSDAGNGVGYSGMRIRGVSGSGINVMLNGIPYNDSESQGTFFVNVPDLTSSASQIVIQRGVGTSTNGVAAFGASINIVSKDPEEKFYFKTDDSYGSFNTYKYSAEIGSGKFCNNKLSVMGRYTRIHSDGYIDRAFSDLHSYNFTALFEEGNTQIRLMTFGGKEKTYQAWNGIDRETWQKDPKFNYSGAIYDANWENIVDFYKNETDNYRQNHYHLLWNQKFSDQWKLETTLHYTRGKGYYENYKQDARFSKYNLDNIFENGTEITSTDFIRKKWLDNHFYGVVSTLYGKLNNLNLNIGLVANQYVGDHFGQVNGVFFNSIKNHEYYRNQSTKNEISGFAKALYQLDKFEFFLDLQLRNINYLTEVLYEGDDEGANLDKSWTFFNPKAGINYRIPSGKLFLSYAIANREPNRDDLLANPDTQPETLHDIEAGLEKQIGKFSLAANVYYMYYKNQLVLNGQINNIGEFIRTNSGKSYRTGIEIGTLYQASQKWNFNVNINVSQNKNLDFNLETDAGIETLGDSDISFSPNIIANLGFQFLPTKNLSLGLMNQYVGKQFLDNSQDKNLQLDDYFLTDFNASYNFRIKKNDITLKLLVNNIFNAKYVNNGYVYDANPYYFAQAGTNFMFGISWKIQ